MVKTMKRHNLNPRKSLFAQDKYTKINHFLKALPHLIFSETVLKNIASRFGITIEELNQRIAEFEGKEAKQNG